MSPPAKPQGMEILLRSMGLGDVLDMSKQLASEGTVHKILAFANGLEALNAKLDALTDRLDRLAPPAGGEPLAGSGPADRLAAAELGAPPPRSNGTAG